MSNEPEKENEQATSSGLDDPPCSPPDVVWLQYHGDSDPVEWEAEQPAEVTWCADQIFDRDIEYVRADLVRELLKGHKCSELLGDGGLIAATMRFFEKSRNIATDNDPVQRSTDPTKQC